MRKSFQHLLTKLLHFSLVFTLGACLLDGCARQDTAGISVARHIWPGYEFMFLAQQLDLLDANQVSFVDTGSASETLDLLRQARVDGGALTLDEVLRARDEGIDLVVVLVFDISAGADVVIAKPDVVSMADWQGLRIGVEKSGVGAIMFEHILSSRQLRRSDLRGVDLPADQQLAAWEQDQVDLMITFEPIASKLLDRGGELVLSSRELTGLIVDVLAFRREALSARGAVEKLVNAHFLALQHFQHNSQDSLYRLAPRLNLPISAVADAYRGLVLPDIKNNQRLLTGKPPALLADAERLASLLLQGGMLQHGLGSKPFIDGSFLAETVH